MLASWASPSLHAAWWAKWTYFLSNFSSSEYYSNTIWTRKDSKVYNPILWDALLQPSSCPSRIRQKRPSSLPRLFPDSTQSDPRALLLLHNTYCSPQSNKNNRTCSQLRALHTCCCLPKLHFGDLHVFQFFLPYKSQELCPLRPKYNRVIPQHLFFLISWKHLPLFSVYWQLVLHKDTSLTDYITRTLGSSWHPADTSKRYFLNEWKRKLFATRSFKISCCNL